MAKRVSKSSIVSTTKRVLPAGHPDLVWYDPNEVIIVGEDSEYKVSGTGVSFSSALLSGSLISGSENPNKVEEEKDKKSSEEPSDVPQLSDIESVQYVKYFDPVSKIEKAKAIIKIRNSSKNKDNVAGVDARIYQPRGL
jgi:hypothetical protein